MQVGIADDNILQNRGNSGTNNVIAEIQML